MKQFFAVILFLATTISPAIAESISVMRYLPLQLNDRNTTVTFTVDSTWHTINGSADSVSGEIVASEDEAVRAIVHLPVKSFDTGNSLRDDKLREVMAAEEEPEVVFALKQFAPTCSLAAVELEQPCSATAQGQLTIRGVTKEIAFPVTLIAHSDRISLEGGDTLLWREYGVEDPSILVARLAESVSIHFAIEIPK